MVCRFIIPALLAAVTLAGCGPSYSPDTYSAAAVQQANKVEQGVIVGVRQVDVSANTTAGTVTGAAAGGIAGAESTPGPLSAFTALGGTLVGGIAGSAAEHGVADTTAYEYIVRKAKDELVSVTQKDKTPLTIGQKVLVISGNQARIVPDYTVSPPVAAGKAADTAKAEPAKSVVPAPQDATAAKPDEPAPAASATPTPGNAAPASGAPASGAPASGAPGSGAPASGAPSTPAPASAAPAGAAPAAPVEKAPSDP